MSVRVQALGTNAPASAGLTDDGIVVTSVLPHKRRAGATWRLAEWLGRASLLGACDCLAIVAAAFAAYSVWAGPVRSQPFEIYRDLWPLLGLFLLVNWRLGLYPGSGLGGIELLRRTVWATNFVFAVMATFAFVFKLEPIYSRMTFFIAWGAALALVPAARFALLAAIGRRAWWREPCLMLGTGRVTEGTILSLKRAFTLGYQPTAALARHKEEVGRTVGGVPVVGQADLAGRFAAHGVRVAILVDEPDEPWSADDLAALQVIFRHVLWIHYRGELPLEGLQLKNLGSMVGIEYANQLLLLRNRVLKRTIDVVLGGILALLTLPLMLLGAAFVRLSSAGPVFFAQVREGASGRPIRVYKLRTMHADAEARLESTLLQDPHVRREWQSRFKLRNDPRIVPVVGRLLRRFSIDELPQLWQVVAGTLSLVGPRPFPRYHLEHYTATALDLRRRVRPGVTGLWQVKARGEGDLELQQSHDQYYIRNWSLWMDLYVLGITAGIVLLGRGAE